MQDDANVKYLVLMVYNIYIYIYNNGCLSTITGTLWSFHQRVCFDRDYTCQARLEITTNQQSSNGNGFKFHHLPIAGSGKSSS